MSDRITQPTNDIGARAGELLKEFRSHYCECKGLPFSADCDFVRTILAIYGVASAPGRVVDRNHNMTFVHMAHDFRWLGDEQQFGHRYGNLRAIWRYELEESAALPTKAAIGMNANSLRGGHRKLASSPEIDAALLAYTDERLELLRRAEELFRDGYKVSKCYDAHRWAVMAAKERRAFERLRAVLVSSQERNAA